MEPLKDEIKRCVTKIRESSVANDLRNNTFLRFIMGVWLGSVAMIIGIAMFDTYETSSVPGWIAIPVILNWIALLVVFGINAVKNVFIDDDDDPEVNAGHIFWTTTVAHALIVLGVINAMVLAGVAFAGPLYLIGIF